MTLTRLVYVSRKTPDCKLEDVVSILDSSRRRNAAEQITGLLCFTNDYFLQCLEGSKRAVNTVYRRILNDPRHSDVLLLHYQEAAIRDFGDWSMGYVAETPKTRSVVSRYSSGAGLDPFSMSGDGALGLLRELREEIPRQ